MVLSLTSFRNSFAYVLVHVAKSGAGIRVPLWLLPMSYPELWLIGLQPSSSADHLQVTCD